MLPDITASEQVIMAPLSTVTPAENMFRVEVSVDCASFSAVSVAMTP